MSTSCGRSVSAVDGHSLSIDCGHSAGPRPILEDKMGLPLQESVEQAFLPVLYGQTRMSDLPNKMGGDKPLPTRYFYIRYSIFVIGFFLFAFFPKRYIIVF